MKYRHLPFFALLVFLSYAQRAAASYDTGYPLQCVGTDTFYPRGDRWSEQPGGTISVRFQPDGPSNQTGTIALPGSVAEDTIFRAFSAWSGVTCASGLAPNLRFAIGANYATRDDGSNGGTQAYQTVVYFAVTANTGQWTADSLTVASTVNHWYLPTMNEQAADMVFNNINFNFRTTNAQGAAYGCNASDSNCYDLETVALHEVGHFLGFNHVACNNAVMYPSNNNTAQTTTLSHHEVGGVCALYPPRTYAGTASTMGESCAADTDCLKGLSCLKPTGADPTASNGWCAQSCSSTSDCTVGWVCGSVGASSPVCQPGVHLAGVPVAAQVAAITDLCAPCADGNQCITGNCGIDPATLDGMCTQTCAAPSYACPNGFACVATQNAFTPNICWPNTSSTCASVYNGVTNNGMCAFAATDSDAQYQRDCASGEVCFVFNSGNGECVHQCTAGSPGITCATGFTCCFGEDSSGHCITSQSGSSLGGCFQIRHAGDTCTVGDLSICDSTTQCLSTLVGTAECYHTCNGDGTNTGCGVGETCVTSGTSTPICCDDSRYDGTNISTCLPVNAACTREVGVACSNNSDCESNYCLKGSTGSFCTAQCSSSSDCPAAGVDVNNDGVGDSGSTCQSIGSQTVCVPGTIAAKPACATGATGGSHSGGGGCATVGVEDFAWTWAIVAMAWAARGLRRARLKTA